MEFIIKEKLNSILLIEDDPATVFLHKRLITKMNCTEEILVAKNGVQALTLIKEKLSYDNLLPDLIFLDINMPKMTGWEFISRFKTFSAGKLSDTVVIMLTYSVNPDDFETARQTDSISGISPKPLTLNSLYNILKTHFKDNLH